MSKFSGTKRRPLRANVKAAVRTTTERALTYEGGLALRARRRVGAVPPGRHQHGRRGHLLRARRRSRRTLRGPRAPGDRSRTRRSSPAPTPRPAGSVWPSTCARPC